MSDTPNCLKCQSEYVYKDSSLYICPECAYEWPSQNEIDVDNTTSTKDANGNTLQDGDTVSVIKDLKIKGSSAVVKVGTKVKNIRLIDSDSNAGHNIDCKITGIGAMKLKSEFVKKA